MQPLDPITLAVIALVVAVLLSALLLLLFVTREEKFEDVVAAQRAEQEAYATRNTSVKPAKQRKKIGKGKKKYAENGEVLEEIPAARVEETVEASSFNNDEDETLQSFEFRVDSNRGEREEKPSVNTEDQESSIGTKERHGKKKSKKAAQKEEDFSLTGRHSQPREIIEETIAVVEMASQHFSSNPEIISKFTEELKAEEELPVIREGAPSAKKAKNKTKAAKDKDSIQGDLSSKRLMELVTSSNLNSSEVQDLIDILLNKQGENSQWKKSTSKGDTLEMLKKQLLEKDNQLTEEHQHAQNAANKLKELRDELHQEKQKHKSQQAAAANKIAMQAKEIQALEARMKASHESHAVELQAVQQQMHQLQEVVTSSSVGNLQRLQEENAQLKNASMRAAQLTADKESLTTELNKLQQSHRQVKSDLANKTELLTKSESQRKATEEQITRLNIQHNSKKEAENALSKRLAEVNEELNKSKARHASLQKEHSSTLQMLRSEESKTQELVERVKGLEAADSNQADSLNSLTAKLQEATARVSELEKMFTGVEQQLKDSQDIQLQKDKEIQVLQDELKVARESLQQTVVANHVDVHTSPEDDKESAKAHEDALKVKEDVIAELHDNLLKRDEEISSLKSLLDEQKQRNNELHRKNWKAMEALSDAEKNTQAQINKALEAAKAANLDTVTHVQNDNLKERDATIQKLHEELKEKKDECKKLEDVVTKQKEKNNELREKNWKAMDAVSEMEKNVNNKVKSALQSSKDENKKLLAEEHITMKTALCRIHPNVEVDSSLPFTKWLSEFEKQASESSKDSQQMEDLARELEDIQNQKDNLTAECAHYKTTLKDTESLLKKLEENVESEMDNWQKIVERAQRELKEANDRIYSLEEDLQKTKASVSAQLETVASLEQRLEQAKAAEDEAKQRFIELQEQLAKSAIPQEGEKVEQLEKELASCKEKEKELNDRIGKLESAEKEVLKYKKQLENAAKELAELETVASLEQRLEQAKAAEDEAKQRFIELQEQLAKSAVPQEGEKVEQLEKELASCKEKEKELNDKIGKLESAEKEVLKYKKQLENAAKELADREGEMKTCKNDLLNSRTTEEELKKKVASLEEALTKPSNDIGKSQESLDNLNSSPEKTEKKKKGLKGALNKVMSKKDKEKDKDKDDKDRAQHLEEAQKQLSLLKSQVENLVTSRDSLEKENKTLKEENHKLHRRSMSADGETNQSKQIEKDLVEAMSDTALSPVKSCLHSIQHTHSGIAKKSSQGGTGV